MRIFECSCGARIFFDNTACLTCGRALGFLPDAQVLSSLEPAEDGTWRTPYGAYRKCSNYVDQGVCNWMIPAGTPSQFCKACELNHVIPDLSQPDNRVLWQEVERAKRRLVYTLDRVRLPVRSKGEDPDHGLAFDIKASVGDTRVLTGHEDGLVTLNLAEADAAQREKVRVAMKERYRTLLGHFRHEVGHYYWDALVKDTPALARFRELFGDERVSYADSLRAHYAGAEPADAARFISNYAASHPWEDFAETFAHYLHMQDTTDTAQAYGFTRKLPENADVAAIADFDLLLDEWADLTVALNALNRSMGQPDAYPFAVTPVVAGKLAYVHDLVAGARAADAQRPLPGARRAAASLP